MEDMKSINFESLVNTCDMPLKCFQNISVEYFNARTDIIKEEPTQKTCTSILLGVENAFDLVLLNVEMNE